MAKNKKSRIYSIRIDINQWAVIAFGRVYQHGKNDFSFASHFYEPQGLASLKRAQRAQIAIFESLQREPE